MNRSPSQRTGGLPAGGARSGVGAWLHDSCWLLAILGSLLLWLAMPPVEWSLLAWIAPVPWLWLARRTTLPGRRPYWAFWFAGFVFWLLAIHWLRLPHPMTSIGWVALSAYLGCYLPLFIALVRQAQRRLRVPLIVAAPALWAALESAQAHLFTGFGMANLGHTQYRFLSLIQVADLGGGYLVGFVVMLCAACLAMALPCAQTLCNQQAAEPNSVRRWRLAPLGIAALVLAAAVGYGQWQLSRPAQRVGPTVALIQGSIDTTLKADPAQVHRVFADYLRLSHAAMAERPDVQLVVWPETMYRYPLVKLLQDQPNIPAEWDAEEVLLAARQGSADLARLAAEIGAALLIGIDAIDLGNQVERYNSAQYVHRDGRLGPRYDKCHPVLFGEYVPLAKRWPWLYSLTPLGGGIDTGRGPVAMQHPTSAGTPVILSPSICYESVLAHRVRDQVAQLRTDGQEPDLLVNLTNDGWFWGSSELDMHLICGVFRAIENRKPLLIAANTGFSAWIDSDGRILERGPRQAEGWIVADVRLDDRRSLYMLLGDWTMAGFWAFAGLLILLGIGDFYRQRQVRSATAKRVDTA